MSDHSILRLPAALLPPDLIDALEKAVDPHHAHVQARGREGRFRSGYAAPRPRAAGKFVRRLTREESAAGSDLARNYIYGRDGFAQRMRTHLRDYRESRIGAGQMIERGESEIRHFYELAYRAGRQAAGDPALVLTPQDRAYLNALVRDETDYLRGFVTDMEEGLGVVPYERRLDMYVNAAQEPAWAGWVLGDQSRDRSIRWHYGLTEEHCRDCRRAVESGWMPVRRFVKDYLSRGLVPQAGRLECHGIHCACRLSERIGGREYYGLSFGGARG